jgi:hypothetical protein
MDIAYVDRQLVPRDITFRIITTNIHGGITSSIIICALQVIACNTDTYDAEAFTIYNMMQLLRSYAIVISQRSNRRTSPGCQNNIRNNECVYGFFSLSFLLSYKMLTLENCIKERSMTFPTVIAKCFCDLTIMRIRSRFCVGVRSYQIDSYTASPIILLWNVQ